MTAYYQKEIETASREEILKIQNEKIRKQVKHVYENVPYYRNLMEEKYAFIEAASKGVAPAPIDPAAEKLVAEIMPLMKASNEKFAAKYPSLASAGQAFGGEVSPAVYMESELRIMEVPTLQMMLRDVKLDPDYVQKIYQGLIGFFGQDSLEKAEVLTKAQTMQSCRGKTL